MMLFNLLLLLMMILSLLLISLNFILSKKSFQDREKISPFECGFDPMGSSHPPLSTQFFLISLIFLIFDIEIAMLIPLIFLMKFFNAFMIYTSILFLFILTYGLYLEYSEQSIEWKI
uniref:NADH-ubiquinone oxidoreductase chain 3 n=1 Tax=Vollenhovia emeryi TaxID=411798 RepID=A0A160DSA5_VOLEM|nr:NADH dehydrogenase subunit 3 [Vollenhovia emeryi]ANA91982.1 NADH dehydrogenase subunit 3 [Vollenhovia emeryi]